MMIAIKCVPKKYNSDWQSFGAPNRKEYEKWHPETCGICCLKMIGDTYGSTANTSLYQLTMECKQKGGFKESPNGEIQGVFHQPLLELAKGYRLDGTIESNLNIKKVIASLQNGRFVILSIDKSKVNQKLRGGHLVLVYAYDPETGIFLINDPEPILAKCGERVRLKFNHLNKISNKKGLVIWNVRKTSHPIP